MEKNVSLEGTSLNQWASFKLSCAKIGSLVQTDGDPEKANKNNKNKKIKKSHKLYTSTPPGTVTADMIKTKLVRVGVLSNVITFAKSEIN